MNQGRNPYDLSRVSEDKPNTPLVKLLQILSRTTQIIFFSEREGTEQCLQDTMEWINKYVNIPYILYTRDKGDYRPDEIIKEELFNKVILNKYYCIAIFDDRNKVVEKWRSLGLLTCQVYDGNF